LLHIFLFIIVAFETFIKSVYSFNNAKSSNNNYKYHVHDVYAVKRKILCKKIDFRKENTKKFLTFCRQQYFKEKLPVSSQVKDLVECSKFHPTWKR